jgi:hypothetical protein
VLGEEEFLERRDLADLWNGPQARRLDHHAA